MAKRFSPYLPRIHADPYSYGSIISGALVHEQIIEALSRDIGSAGSPSFFH